MPELTPRRAVQAAIVLAGLLAPVALGWSRLAATAALAAAWAVALGIEWVARRL